MGKVKKNFFIIFLILVLGVNFVFGYEIVGSVKVNLNLVSSYQGGYYDENNNYNSWNYYYIALYQSPANSIIDTIEIQRKSQTFIKFFQPLIYNSYIDYVDVIEAEMTDMLRFKRILARWDFTNPDYPRLYCGNKYYVYPSGYFSDCNFTSSGVFDFKYLTDEPYIQNNNNKYIVFRFKSGSATTFNLSYDNFVGLNNLINFYGSIKIYTQLVFPSGFNFNVDDYNNNLVFKIFSVNEFNNISSFKLEVIDYFTGQVLYNSGLKTANVSITPLQLEEKTLYLPNYGINLKQVLTDLKNNLKTNLKLKLTLYLTGSGGQVFIRDEVNLVLQGFQIVGQTYQDWYNSVIGSFGLSEATPTPIFQKSAEFIDNTFQTFQSFITIDNDKLNNLKASVIDNLNTFIGYINGFTDALGFLKYLFYGLLVFTMIEFIVKFGRLIIPFK